MKVFVTNAHVDYSLTSTYFVEYVFPTTLASSHHALRSGDGEVVRAVSRKMTGEGMTF